MMRHGHLRRFIPTRVGQTRAAAWSMSTATVHPHARGADMTERIDELPQAGSSPRAWGRLPGHDLRNSHRRFIPTRVGQTSHHHPRRRRSPVHPHARGADPGQDGLRPGGLGSSPRAWGRRLSGTNKQPMTRFIPTRVGQTSRLFQQRGSLAVHPHARGADNAPWLWQQAGSGSSPRAWGRLGHPGRGAPKGRFIPTRVGQTRQRPGGVEQRPVHPHARGADFAAVGGALQVFGSSPRAWGRPPPAPAPEVSPRFIPTRVGQTSPSRS